jgi:steroid 5-alpha reductase family enzyme
MFSDSMMNAALAIAVVMVSTWLLSVALKNASIVDIVWGAGFVVVTWVMQLTIEGDSSRQWLITAMVSIWGLRLSGYLARRNIGHGEDWRYVAMRKRHGRRFPLVSLVTVFALQGVVMFLVSLPVQLGHADRSPSVGPLAVMGLLVWFLGIVFEAVGDMQLRRFKKDPSNAGLVMDRGLWSLTRHPNYFGDSCVWWGIGIVAAEAGTAAWGLIGPVVMTLFLTKVSGVPMLERSLAKRKPGYADYMARTSGFFPRPPKKV